MSGERLGIPSVGIMTEEFVSAAELMARVLGATEHRFAIIPHPISSASATELASAAQTAADRCAALLTSVPGDAR